MRTTAIVVFLMAVGTTAPAFGQDAAAGTTAPAFGRDAAEGTAAPAFGQNAGVRSALAIRIQGSLIPANASDFEKSNVPPDAGSERRSSPSQLRQRLLYRDGEFSTFHRRSTDLAARLETRLPKDSLHRQTDDRWFAFDKVQHLTFSFLWTLSTQYVAVNKGRISEEHALPLSISSGAAIGVSKEYYDLTVGPTRYFSTKDLVADAAGILLAVGVILL